MRVFLSISAIAALCVMMYFTQSGSTEKSLRGGSGMAGHQGKQTSTIMKVLSMIGLS